MKRTLITCWMFIMSLLFTCCTTAVRTPGAMIPPAGPAVAGQEYQVQVGDALDIKLFYHPELNESVIVRPDGRISLAVGPRGPGLGPDSGTIAPAAPGSIRPPDQPTGDQPLSSAPSPPRRFTWMARWPSPDLSPLTGKMTLLQSLASAGGMKTRPGSTRSSSSAGDRKTARPRCWSTSEKSIDGRRPVPRHPL